MAAKTLKEKITLRNLTLNTVALVAASTLAVYSFAAPDYDRIKKDINVMTGIVKSSFENSDNCRRHCNIFVKGHYLANQGVVFTVDTSGGHPFGVSSGVFDAHEIMRFTEGVIGIPGMVEDILEDVEVDFSGGNRTIKIISDDEDWTDVDRETRVKLRGIRRDIRELAQELREIEIEAIHADDEERDDVAARRTELEDDIQALENREKEIRTDIASVMEKRSNERAIKSAERQETRELKFKEMESVVLNTFCDYSSTMRNIPKDENISVIIEKEDGQSSINVFKQSDLNDCDSQNSDVRTTAQSYLF
jgi:hypothetical protein